MRTRPRPHHQGRLDTLCGVYAIINAVALVMAPRRHFLTGHCSALFAAITADLEARGVLRDTLHEGIGPRQEWRCARVAARHVNMEHGITLKVSRPFRKQKPGSIDELLTALAEGARSGAAFIIGISGAFGHWTVLRGATQRSLLLQDSYGMGAIRRQGCRLGADADSGTWVISAKSTIRFEVGG